MSVSSRDRKDVIYAELQRLRQLVDQQEQQLRAANEEIERLSAQRQAPSTSERSAQLQVAKALAMKHRCIVRIRDGAIERYSRDRQCWVTVSEGAQS
jgi:hypothetical protein